MDNKVEILLGSEKNINSINVDGYTKVELTNNVAAMTEFTVNDVVNSTDVFDAERDENQVYRIYGRIEWMSLLNGITTTHPELQDFFNPQYDSTSKNIFNSFHFYLVAPSSGQTYGSVVDSNYKRRTFEVVAGKDDIEIFNAGFTNNVYGEQVYAFNFKTDIDVGEYYDSLGFPLTELFIYAQYIRQASSIEEMSRTVFSYFGAETKSDLTTKYLYVGDIVEDYQNFDIQDVIEYDEEEYSQEQITPQTYYIRTRYSDSGYKWLEWKYNPFIPLRLRYLDGVVSTAKLAEVVKDTSTLDVYMVNSPSNEINATKTLAQTVSTTSAVITKWDDVNPSITYNWDSTTGELEFIPNVSLQYNITFKTQMFLPTGTDKYIGEIYLEENIGSSWNEISNTRRRFLITNSTQGINITKSYTNGDKIRVRTTLIPNPDERRMFEVPDYATMMTSKGKYVWRDILPQGYVDPITNDGVDYPFFNKRRYLFEPIVLDITPNLEHTNTQDVFAEISYTSNATVTDQTPVTDLDNIGKPCQ